MENKEHFGSLTKRMQAFREEVLEEKPHIDAERAVLATESYRAHQNQPPVMKRALMLKNILEKMSIYIEDRTLIAGNQATKNCNAPIFPEYTMGFVMEELDKFQQRDGDVFYITEETKAQLRSLAPFWENNNLRARGEALLPDEVSVFMETGLFGMEGKPKAEADYLLNIHLADHATKFMPLVKVSLNDVDTKVQILKEGVDFSAQSKARQNEEITDTLGITGNLSAASPYTIAIPLKGRDLRKGSNQLVISVLEGSWILFDQIELLGPSPMKVKTPHGVFVRGAAPAPYQLGSSVQPLLVDLEHLEGEPEISVKVGGKTILKKTIEKGRYCLEAPMPAVPAARKSRYAVYCDGKKIASGRIDRSPQPLQTPAGYVDTRIGTAHSRWMLAPGPWMPFSMVKLSPDNQNAGW